MKPLSHSHALLGCILLSAFTLGTASPLFAASEGNWSVNLANRLEVIEDTRDSLSFQDIQSEEEANRFRPVGTQSWLFQPGSLWVRFSLRDNEIEHDRAHIICTLSYLDHLEFYIPKPEGGYTLTTVGDTLPFNERPIRVPLYVIPVSPSEIGSQPIFIRVKSSGSIELPFYLYGHARATDHTLIASSWGTAAMLTAILVAGFFFTIAFAARDLSYFLLAGWISAITLLLGAHTGHGFALLWPNAPGLNAFIPSFNLSSNCLFLLFAMTALSTRSETPKTHRAGLVCLALLTVLLALSLLGPMKYGAPVVPLGYLLALWGLIPAIIRAYRGYRPAYYFILAYGPGLVVLLVYVYTWAGLNERTVPDPSSTIIDYFYSFGGASVGFIQVILMALTVAERINVFRQETESAQATALALEQAHAFELETKVEAQTMQLREANRELSRLDERKTHFFSSISHELRTPLTLILNPLTSVLAEQPGNKQIQVASKHAQRLLRLVNQLLDFQKLSAGKMDLAVSTIKVDNFIDTCGQTFSSACVAKEIDFTVNRPNPFNSLPALIEGNVDALEKVVFNYLSNALKFTPSGGTVELGLEVERDRVRIFVTDTGPGISEERQQELFDVFSKVTSATSRQYEGSGLGLALAREMTEAMNGQVGVDSTVGRGSTFWASFPRVESDVGATTSEFEVKQWLLADTTEPTSTPNRGEPTPSTEGSRSVATILVVDDVDDMRDLIADLMESRGYTTVRAEDGQKGLDLARVHQPDLIISDWMMPQLTGPELIEALRLDPVTQSIPTILLTARGDETSKIQGTQSGASGFLSKPFSNVELESTVDNLLQLKEREREVTKLNRFLTESVLSRYLPQPVVDQIVDGDLSFTESPRAYVATVLFSDLKGFTAMSNKLPAAKVGKLLNQYFEVMTEIVFEHEGTLDKFIGDAMMVLFGAPVEMSPNEQARRAARCALAMQLAVPQLNAIWEAEGLQPPACRIGIHQGPVVVGNFGSQRRSDYTAIGTTVNLASRLESVCEAGEALVSVDIANFLPEEAFTRAGEFKLKGFGEMVPAFRLRTPEKPLDTT